MTPPSWTTARVEALLRTPHELVDDPAWQSWFAAHGGLAGVYDTLRQVPLKPHLADLLALLLDEPTADWAGYAARLRVHPSTYYRHIKALLQQLTTALAADLLPWPPSAPRLRGVPAPTSALIGRATELAAITAALAAPEQAVVTLTGPGGVGKTRLALEAAHTLAADFPGGVVWVSLIDARTPTDVVRTLATALEVAPNAQAEQTLRGRLLLEPLLLVVDNAEHVLHAASLLGRLGQAGQSRVLVTSRTPLQVPNERQLRVPPLATALGTAEPPASTLFLARAAEQLGSAAAQLDRAVVGAICTQASGLPLAIELLAARTAVLSVETIQAQFAAEPLGSMAQDGLAPDSRHRSLDAALRWSYALLTRGTRRWFEMASVCRGGWDLAALQALEPEAEAGEAAEGMLRLLQTSLVQREVTEGRGERFGMLEIVRRYAEEQLVAQGATALAVRNRHATHYLTLAQTWMAEITNPASAERTRLHQERENILAALHWCLYEGGSRRLGMLATAALVDFLDRTMAYEPYVRLLRTARQHADPATDTDIAYELLRSEIYILPLIGLPDEAAHEVDTFLATGNVDTEKQLRLRLLTVDNSKNTPDSIEKSLRETLTIANANNYQHIQIWVHNTLARMYNMAGRYSESIQYFEQAIDLIPEGKKNEYLNILINKSFVHMNIGELDTAESILLELLAIPSGILSPYYYSAIFCNLGAMYFTRKNYNIARDYQLQALRAAQDASIISSTVTIYYNIGEIDIKEGNILSGLRMLQKSLKISHLAWKQLNFCAVLALLGCVAVQMNQWTDGAFLLEFVTVAEAAYTVRLPDSNMVDVHLAREELERHLAPDALAAARRRAAAVPFDDYLSVLTQIMPLVDRLIGLAAHA